MSEVPRKRVLVADVDEIVAFIATHILTRYDVAVDTVTNAADLRARNNGYDAIVVSDALADELGAALDPAHAIVLGDALPGLKPFAQLRKPIELDLLVTAVRACAGRRT